MSSNSATKKRTRFKMQYVENKLWKTALIILELFGHNYLYLPGNDTKIGQPALFAAIKVIQSPHVFRIYLEIEHADVLLQASRTGTFGYGYDVLLQQIPQHYLSGSFAVLLRYLLNFLVLDHRWQFPITGI